MSLRRRLAIAALATSAASLLAVLFLVGPGLRGRATEAIRERLMAEARLLAQLVAEPLARGGGPDAVDPLVDATAGDVAARVTVIGVDGRVLGESTLSGAALLRMENHAARPEVREALRLGEGYSTRRSTTVEDELLYVAVPVRHQGRLVGVARLAVPLTGVAQQAGALRRAVALALLLAFAITALVSAALAPSLAGPMREIMDGARRFAAGELQARIRTERRDELGELARILNHTAAQLQQRLTEGARDRARSEAILKAMEDGVLAVDHKGGVVLANAALRAALGLDDLVGRHYLEAIRQRELYELIEAVLRTGERRTALLEIRHLRRSFAIAGVPYPGDQGAPHGAVLTFHDVTERHRVERMRRDFVANASHELRTPLTSIRGFVEALEDGALAQPATAARFLAKIRSHTERMAGLVQDLLELSRIEAGERPPQLAPTRPAEIAREVLDAFRDAAARKRIELRESGGDAPVVPADPDHVRRILENFVDNAIKYTSEAGRVEVSTAAAEDGGAEIAVKDDGPGIAPEHLARVFERFYRVDKARSREIGGTGLGLAIAKHLAEDMGASLSVRSEPGRGSTFALRLKRDPVAGGRAGRLD
jgi:two-component system phosphate regulon sensor histidine kinase PhoR